MLPRLARWLVQPAEAANDGFAAVARRYVDDGSFVDWARKVVWGSAPGEPLASALVVRSRATPAATADVAKPARREYCQAVAHHLRTQLDAFDLPLGPSSPLATLPVEVHPVSC